jgi:hypothetical protein
MNDSNMQDTVKIVNNRVVSMLESGDVNNECFYQDVRTLTAMIRRMLKEEEEV